MYHLVVRGILRRGFRDINEGAYERLLPKFAARGLRHVMHGQHALGGERHTLASAAQWYDRLKRLLPDLQFDVREIVVSGWPWRTVAMVSWADRFSLPDGTRGSNRGVHEFVLRWGRVQSMQVHCDTGRLAQYLQRMAQLGVAEAVAAPIGDAVAQDEWWAEAHPTKATAAASARAWTASP